MDMYDTILSIGGCTYMNLREIFKQVIMKGFALLGFGSGISILCNKRVSKYNKTFGKNSPIVNSEGKGIVTININDGHADERK